MEEIARSLGKAKMPGRVRLGSCSPCQPKHKRRETFQHKSRPGARRGPIATLSENGTASPRAEENFSDALSRSYTIVRDRNLHRRD
jgi:hypothetical protein